jgi:hypothetical protein
MRVQFLIALAASAAFLSSCSDKQPGLSNRKGLISLPGFAPLRGGHCESAAMLNALAYLGYGLSEADIVGGSGGISFLYAGRPFPFIGGRSPDLRESFLDAAGIPYRVVLPEDGAAEWTGVIAALDRGLPVLLRVDMRWLPYLYGGKYGSPYMSFGGHWVCLVGMDFDRGLAYVTDTDRQGIQEVALTDLRKARESGTRTFPPKGEYAWIEPKPKGWAFDLDAVTRSSLASILRNYASDDSQSPGAGALVGLGGLSAFPDTLASLHRIVNPHAIAVAYSYMAGSIERNGTGGSAFRRFYGDFLAARSADCVDPRLRAACSDLSLSVERTKAAWGSLARAFDEAAAEIGSAKGSDRGAAISRAEARTAALARELSAAESDFFSAAERAAGKLEIEKGQGRIR